MRHSDTTSKVLALDLGTTTGHALLANGIITSGSKTFRRLKDHGIKALRFHKWLRERISEDKPQAIAFEEVYRWSSSSAAHIYCGMRWQVREEAYAHGITVYDYSPTAIKKHWTGKGNADKKLMTATTIMRFPELELHDDNEADALAILHLHLSTQALEQNTQK